MEPIRISTEEFEATFSGLDNSGVCTECREITHDGCEPDAREYECPVCGNNTVYGLEEAMMMGLLEVN